MDFLSISRDISGINLDRAEKQGVDLVPTYEYECDRHGKFEEVHSIASMPDVAKCPQCTKPAKRIYDPTPVIFKAKGFYKTGE